MIASCPGVVSDRSSIRSSQIGQIQRLVLREVVVTLGLVMEAGDFIQVTGDFARAGQVANPGTHGGTLPKSAFNKLLGVSLV